jgi:hypothetical protein
MRKDETEKNEIRKQLDDLRKRLIETHSPEQLQSMKVKVDVLESMMRMADSMHDDDTDEEGHHHHVHESEFAAL